MTITTQNYWLKKVAKVAPQIEKLFEKAEETQNSRCRQKLLFEAAWRMGLIRFLRVTHDQVLCNLLADQIEPRYWWGCEENWEDAVAGWHRTATDNPINFSNFIKLCFAEDELKMAAVENPDITPDDSPATDEEFVKIAEGALDQFENPDDYPEDPYGYMGIEQFEERLNEIAELWQQQRSRLTPREEMLARRWVELVGDAPTGVWSPPWQWAGFMLFNFT